MIFINLGGGRWWESSAAIARHTQGLRRKRREKKKNTSGSLGVSTFKPVPDLDLQNRLDFSYFRVRQIVLLHFTIFDTLICHCVRRTKELTDDVVVW